MITWCCVAALLAACGLVEARTNRGSGVDQQLARIRTIQDESGVRLQGNQDWHNWIMVNSQQQMPQRLELFYKNLNRSNMRRRLFYIYKWSVGRREATRAGYAAWLEKLVAWMQETTGVELPSQDLEEDDDMIDEEDEAMMNDEETDEVADEVDDELEDETVAEEKPGEVAKADKEEKVKPGVEAKDETAEEKKP